MGWTSIFIFLSNINVTGAERAQSVQRRAMDWTVGFDSRQGKRLFSTPVRPDRLWGPFSFLYNGCREICPRGPGGRGVKLTTHLHLMPRSRMVALYLQSSNMSSWHSVQLIKHRDFTFTIAARQWWTGGIRCKSSTLRQIHMYKQWIQYVR
jgi:hypothetical protein